MMCMIKVIIFDLDNTLIDFIKMKNISVEASVDAMIGAGLQETKKKAIKDIFEIYDKIGMEAKDIFQKYLKQVLGKIDYRILGSGIAAYRRVHTSFYEPYPHVIPTLIHLKEKGIRFAILSDAPRLKAWIRLCSIKIDHFVDTVVTYDDTRRYKPDKKPFLYILKKMGVSADDCLMVGDNLDRDILGAKRVGMKTALAKYGVMPNKYNSNKTNTKSDYVIVDFSDLEKIV